VPFEDSVGALAELAREGKIRWVGLSNVSVAQIRAAETITSIQAVQNRLSPFFRESIADGVVDYCARRRIGFLAYSPTGGGRLNLKLPNHPVLARIAGELGVTAHQVVLAWVLARGRTVIAIPSARKVEHVEDSARAGELELSAADLEAITQAEFSRA
jgi:aryl-alcohol dehydrogenase-like predicted oxidoreductase